MNFLMVDCGSDWAFVFVFTDSILSINAVVLVDINIIDEKNEKDKKTLLNLTPENYIGIANKLILETYEDIEETVWLILKILTAQNLKLLIK